jgi:drug/metabolite transporter (DMT)-like permease
MRARDLAELVALAALWGAAFLFIRVAAPSFGPVALVFLRVGGAALVLGPLLLRNADARHALRTHWRPIGLLGLTNTVLPFLGFSIAALALSAGLSSIFNATTPLWAALFAWAWLGDRPTATRWLGLAIGFAGVLLLVFDKASLRPGEHGVSPALAIAACVAAAAGYGFSATYTKRRLAGVPPMSGATGSQIAAALALVAPAAFSWPDAAPPATDWLMVALLALPCTALAILMYFRLIANVGSAQAATVTFLIPPFSIVWGAVFLDETLTLPMVVGCAVILAGTALATGVLPRAPRSSPAADPRVVAADTLPR